MKKFSGWSRSHLEPLVFAWSRSRPKYVGTGVGSGTLAIRSRPKIGGSATLHTQLLFGPYCSIKICEKTSKFVKSVYIPVVIAVEYEDTHFSQIPVYRYLKKNEKFR